MNNADVKPPSGPNAAVVIGNYTMLHEAARDYVVIAAAADNVMIPENLEELLLSMRKYPEAMLFAGQNNIYSEKRYKLFEAGKYVSVFCPPGMFEAWSYVCLRELMMLLHTLQR